MRDGLKRKHRYVHRVRKLEKEKREVSSGSLFKIKFRWQMVKDDSRNKYSTINLSKTMDFSLPKYLQDYGFVHSKA
jgi:hypothetical protein